MSGYKTILILRHLEKEVDQLGFVLEAPRSSGWGTSDFDDRVSIIPKDENALPIYTRDAEIFTGTLENLRIWLQGVQWAREYDRMLKVSDDKTRAKKEEHERGRQLIAKLKKDHSNGTTK
jgi:hypothetical protein